MADDIKNTDTVAEETVQEEVTPAPIQSESVEESTASPEVVVGVKPVSKNLAGIIETIEKLSVIELADLVKALEERFGVTAAAPTTTPVGAGPASGDAPAGEAQTSFDVILTSGGANKIAVIKAVRELVPTLGLKEAKDLVEGAPKPVLEGIKKEPAEEAKTKLTAAGGTVELQ